MKLVILSDNFDLGGGTQYVLNLCKGLVSRGHDIVFYSINRIRDNIDILDGIPIVCHVSSDSRFSIDRIKKTFIDISNFNPDIILANSGFLSYELLRYIPEHVLKIVMIHCNENSLFNLISKYDKFINYYIAVSSEINSNFSEVTQINKEKIRTIQVGISLDADQLRVIDNDSNAIFAVYSGRYVNTSKRFDLMLDIAEKSICDCENLTWNFIGDGDQVKLLNDLCIKYPGRVINHGLSTNLSVMNILKKSHIFMLCSDTEGLPISLIEAMGSGMVCVVPDIPGGILSVVDSNRGVIISKRDANSFSSAIRDICNDLDKYNFIRTNAQNYIMCNHTIDKMADDFEYYFKIDQNRVDEEWCKSIKISKYKVGGPGRLIRLVHKYCILSLNKLGLLRK